MKLPDGNGIGKDPYQNSGMKQQRGRQMKKTLGMAVMLTVFTAFAFLSPAGADFKKTKIAVLDFQLHGDRYETADMGKIVAEWLITALVKEGRFDVIERRLLEKVLSEQKLGATGLIDEQHVTKLGKVLGAKVVITGSLMKFQNVIEANSRIIDVETGAVVAAEIVRSTSTAKLEDLVVQMADKIIRDFPLEGYIVKRTGKSVLIDLGRRSGVKKGLRFVVYKEGNVIKHPKTGEVLDIERIETGTIEISVLNEKTAEALITSEASPNSVEYGQLVKSFKETSSSQPLPRTEVRPEKFRKEIAAQPDIAAVEATVEDMKQLKRSGNSEWKRKNKEALKSLKVLSRTYKKSPELSLAHARYYAALDDLSEAEDYVDQALNFKADPTATYLFKGDLFLDASVVKRGYAKDAARAYEKAAATTADKGLQASLYLKIGNIFADLLAHTDKATEFWKKAVAAQPGGDAAREAVERMEVAKSRK